MRLQKFEIVNFKGIERCEFEWDDLIVLIGENNSGKSTVLQALQLRDLQKGGELCGQNPQGSQAR
jgi:predicted ATP-dependent endonuclease of OLD family